ncbi:MULTISPECIES: flagellin [Alphaproteobacteria]|nr:MULTISPECIES: flagellin [Alphaproteobacteria]
MVSIQTNGAAIAALDTLRSINSQLDTTQSRVSSGYRVETAADNAAYWSIATTMRSDNKALSAVQDALSLGAAKVDTAYTGMEAAIDVVDEIKAKLVAAREPGVDKEKINSEITELKSQITSIVESSNFSGQNWLKWDNDQNPWSLPDTELVGSFTRHADGTVSVDTITYDNIDTSTFPRSNALIDNSDGTMGEFGVLTSDTYSSGLGYTTGWVLIQSQGASSGGYAYMGGDTEISLSSATTSSEVEEMISVVDAMLQDMTDVSADLGALNARLTSQNEYVSDLSDTIETGIGRLVDADMNEESTRLKALQTQQQLGIQSLSIANSNSENILSLFR